MSVNAIVDLSHHNQSVNFGTAKAAGLLAVIHKATQGTSFTDSAYAHRRQQALDVGLLWGAYHFGDGSDGATQAKFFLDTVGVQPNQLVVLDFEANPQGTSMTIAQAHDFVTYIFEQTGSWPGFYCGGDFKRLVGSNVDSIIGNCWLWLAQYAAKPVIPPTWQDWTMWQYTDGSVGPPPHTVAGIGACDRDQFNGTASELIDFWQASGWVSDV